MIVLWLFFFFLSVRNTYRSIYRLNDVIPEISLKLFHQRKKSKKRERKEKVRWDRNGKMLITVQLSKLGIKNMGFIVPIYISYPILIWNYETKFLNFAYKCVVCMWVYIYKFVRHFGKCKERWTHVIFDLKG